MEELRLRQHADQHESQDEESDYDYSKDYESDPDTDYMEVGREVNRVHYLQNSVSGYDLVLTLWVEPAYQPSMKRDLINVTN